jgi:hypothetical protein
MVAALILAGNLSRTYAASGTDGSRAYVASGTDGPSGRVLRNLTRIRRYQCTATFEQYPSQTFCAETREHLPNYGFFTFTEDNIYVSSCSYGAEGDPPNTVFGVSTDFFCHGQNTGMAQVGRVAGDTIEGQAYWLNVVGGVRSVFTCQAVATCP